MRAEISEQSLTAVPLRSELRREPPEPQAPRHDQAFGGPLQWALEERGWAILRPTIDFILLWTAVVVALGGIHATLNVPSQRAPLLALPALVVVLFYSRGLYRTRLRNLLLDGFVPIVSAVSVAAMAVAVLGTFANGQFPTESVWLRAWFFALVAVGLARVALGLAQRQARCMRLVGKPVLIVGAGIVGAQVARRLGRHPEYGLAPIGFLDEDPRSATEVGELEVPVLGTVGTLRDAIQATGVRNVIVAFSSIPDAHISRLIRDCQASGVDVSVVPRMFETINDQSGYETLRGLPLLSFAAVDPDGLRFAIKHAIDRILASLLLVALAPLLLGAALAVRLTSSGPSLFRQRRVGRDGKVFDLYKFRSMREDSSAAEVDGAATGSLEFFVTPGVAPGGIEGEDRRTAVGRFLRSSSLDELPQLFNVLRGDMSLVGPRPERPEFVELFRRDIVRYADRHRVKSGITGWAQVTGLRGQTSLAERVELDNYYISHWSLGGDIKILLRTVPTVLKHRGL